MPITLKSTGGGSVSIDVPSTGSTFTLTAPANNATIFTTDGGAITGNVAFTSNNVSIGGQTISPFGGMKNRVINGDMRIWQRGTSFTNPTVSGSFFTADRWGVNRAGDATGATVSRSTSAPTGFQYSLALQRTAGQTGTAGLYLFNSNETLNVIDLAGKNVTLSFWARAGANYSGTSLNVNVYSGTGTDEKVYAYTGLYTVSSLVATPTSTWTRFTVTGTVPSNATELGFVMYWTPSGTAGADDTVYLTGIQLEEGSVATPFERRLYGTELALCQRYYYRLKGTGANYPFGLAHCYGAVTAGAIIPFPVTMRSAPSALEQSGTAGDYALYSAAGGQIICSAVPTYANVLTTTSYGAVNFTVASGLNAGNITQLTSSGSSGYLGWSAEL